ncbi:amidohydrolase [Anopheles sinensis]|uniref:Amidohydrolase n=1 Tax=Anopheles sinensis TaxID=74873 RepID=A0A084VJM1_ANOSI|nr:amidohydrolase [Anopheles sinensis]
MHVVGTRRRNGTAALRRECEDECERQGGPRSPVLGGLWVGADRVGGLVGTRGGV